MILTIFFIEKTRGDFDTTPEKNAFQHRLYAQSPKKSMFRRAPVDKSRCFGKRYESATSYFMEVGMRSLLFYGSCDAWRSYFTEAWMHNLLFYGGWNARPPILCSV